MDDNKKNKSLFVGIGLIVVGLIVLIERLGFYSDFITTWLYRWESVLILVGLLMILVRRNVFGGLAAMAFGIYFLLDEFYFLPANWEMWFLPGILILGGIAYIFKPQTKERTK